MFETSGEYVRSYDKLLIRKNGVTRARRLAEYTPVYTSLIILPVVVHIMRAASTRSVYYDVFRRPVVLHMGSLKLICWSIKINWFVFGARSKKIRTSRSNAVTHLWVINIFRDDCTSSVSIRNRPTNAFVLKIKTVIVIICV